VSRICSHLPGYEDGTECSETSVYKIQTPGNYPKESIQHTEHGKSLKSKIYTLLHRIRYLSLLLSTLVSQITLVNELLSLICLLDIMLLLNYWCPNFCFVLSIRQICCILLYIKRLWIQRHAEFDSRNNSFRCFVRPRLLVSVIDSWYMLSL